MYEERSGKLVTGIVGLFLLTMLGSFILPERAGAIEQPVIIGISHWEAFPYAEMMKNSYQMALEQINKEGGIKNRSVKLVYANDQGKRESGEKAIRKLVRDGAVMLIGGYTSTNTIYTARIADKLDIPFLICTAADDRITQKKWKNVFRLNPPASGYAKGLEDFFLKEVKPESMGIIYENSPYGTDSALQMMWFCRENDIDIRKVIPYYKERASSVYFQKIMAPLEENPPDVIYMVSYPKDGSLLVKQIRESGINALLCGGAGGYTHQKFITMAGESAEKLLTATLWFHQLTYPGTKAYVDAYRKAYASLPDYHGAEAYSALLVAANVLRRTESFHPESIRTALNRTDLKTPFGPVKFESYGKFERQNSLPTMVLQILDGKFQSIWPPDLSTSTFTPPAGWRED